MIEEMAMIESAFCLGAVLHCFGRALSPYRKTALPRRSNKVTAMIV